MKKCFVFKYKSTLTFAGLMLVLGEGDKSKIFTFYFFLDLKIWRRPKPCQRRQKIEIDLRFSDPPVGPMENAKNKKSEFFFDYGQNVF